MKEMESARKVPHSEEVTHTKMIVTRVGMIP
jgi:hypothetical protein